MKEKFSIYFFLFICFFMSFSVCTFASDGSSDSDEDDTSFGEQIANVLYTLGYALDDLTDGSKVEGLGAVGADFLRGIAIGVDSDAVLQADALFGEGILTEVEYYERLCYLLYEHNYLLSADVDMEGQFVSSFNGFSEVAVEAFEAYIEQNYLDYKVLYTVSCYDVSTANWTNIAQWNIMTDAASAKDNGSDDNQSFINPDISLDSQVYAVGRNNAGGILYFANVSGLSFVCSSASQFQNVLSYNFSGKGSLGNIGTVKLYDSSGATASVSQYDYFYGAYDALKYHSMISSWPVRYTNDDSGYFFNYFVDGGEERLPILFFEDVQALNRYLAGQSSVYYIPTDYTGGDIVVDTNIDYDALYDTIRDAVSGLEGASPSDIQQAINDAVSGYLDDIKFNTAETNTWLQRIYNKLEDIRAEVSSGFDWIKTELAALLVVNVVDIVWDDVKEDIEEAAAMAASLKDLAESKFPFSIAKDIGLLLTMFRAEPVEPVFEIPFNFMGEETIVTLDLTSAEDFLPYVRSGFILVFIAGLFGLSIKIIPIISGGA